eukprot:3074475-Prymnesium_polylepis.1
MAPALMRHVNATCTWSRRVVLGLHARRPRRPGSNSISACGPPRMRIWPGRHREPMALHQQVSCGTRATKQEDEDGCQYKKRATYVKVRGACRGRCITANVALTNAVRMRWRCC